MINNERPHVKRFRAMQGSLSMQSKPKLIWQKPKLKANDPRLITINDKLSKLLMNMQKFNNIKL